MKSKKSKSGVALIEILLATSILATVILAIYSGVTVSSRAIYNNKNLTHAILIAKTKMREFQKEKMRGLDLTDEKIEEYDNFTLDREHTKYEMPLLEPLKFKQVVITVKWKDANQEKKYSLTYIYMAENGIF